MGRAARKNAVMPRCFTAIDFETADHGRDSACSVALVKVIDLVIVERWYRLIRPPRSTFAFSYIHGITWRHVAKEPTFAELWPEFAARIEGVGFLAAHNAGFDRSILNNCCTTAGIKPPVVPFRCTVQMARETWDVFPTKLPDVCRHLKIPLVHHHAESDAEACAHIVIAAAKHAATANR